MSASLVGSEMCIRDRPAGERSLPEEAAPGGGDPEAGLRRREEDLAGRRGLLAAAEPAASGPAKTRRGDSAAGS
eukprot:3236903-Alexandrium_andersonii.AAC.1